MVLFFIYSDFVGERGELTNATVAAAGGELFYLRPGVYHAKMENTTHLPFQWGTVVIEKSGVKYGTVKLYTPNGRICYRSFSHDDSTEHIWLHDWDDYVSTSILAAKIGSNIEKLDYDWDNNAPKLLVTDANGATFYAPLTRK